METQLISALRIGLFEHIYHATPNRRWLSLHLRWRLVSKRFNHFIMHLDYGSDLFLRTMLQLCSDLIYADEFFASAYLDLEPVGYFWRKMVSLFQVLDCLYGEGYTYKNKTWIEIVEKDPTALAVLALISPERLWNEFGLWRVARPRVNFPLVVRPEYLSPDAFIESFRITTPYVKLLRSRQFDSPQRARCYQCWRISGRSKRALEPGAHHFYGEPLTGMVMDGTYQCSPCETAQGARISLVREAASRLKIEERNAKRKFEWDFIEE